MIGKGTSPPAPVHGLMSKGTMQVSVHLNLSRVRNCVPITGRYALLKLWKEERLSEDVLAGLNPLYDMTSDDRALDSNSVFLPRWESNTKMHSIHRPLPEQNGNIPTGSKCNKVGKGNVGSSPLLCDHAAVTC